MKLSKYQVRELKKKHTYAKELYRRGLTTREIAPLVQKSHTWVWLAVKSLSTGGLYKSLQKE